MAAKRFRFPGLNYFTEEDQDIFCGRSEDSNKLFTQIMVGQTLVLHAESGTGKSSLIRAGLIPLLREKLPDLPIKIFRFDDKNLPLKKNDPRAKANVGILVQYIIDNLKEFISDNGDLPLLPGAEDNLWLIAKKIARGKEIGSRQPQLLLIFDQFEEFQTFSGSVVKAFKKQIAELTGPNMPAPHYERMQDQIETLLQERELNEQDREAYSDQIKFLQAPLNVKLIFVVREDKLGAISLLSDILPDIYKNDMYLQSLTAPNAKLAFIEPGKASGEYESPKFHFEDEDVLVENLVKTIRDDDSQLVDPIQIQIICSNIEKNVIQKRFKYLTNSVKVIQSDIPDITDTINNFYINSWNAVNQDLATAFPDITEAIVDAIRKKIVRELVVDDHKNLVNEIKLMTGDHKEESSIAVKTLISTGLLHGVPTDDEHYIQLCHDRFIKPVTEDNLRIKALEDAETEQRNLEAAKLKRKEKDRQIRFVATLIGIVLFIIAGSLLYAYLRIKANREKQQNLDIVRITRRSNPQLSFLIAQNWLESHTDADFNSFVKSFRSAHTPSLLGIYYQPSAIGDASLNGYSMSILGSNSYTTWDTRSRMITGYKEFFMGECLRRFVRNKKVYYLVHSGKNLEIRDTNKVLITQCKVGSKRPATAISQDGRWILIGKELCDFDNPKLWIKLPEDNINKTALLVSGVFFKNGSHLAAAFSTGYKIIYKIDKNAPSKTTISLLLPPSNRQIYSAVNAISIDSANRYLVAGNTKNEVEIWRLPDFHILDTRLKNLPTKDQQRTLKDSINKKRPLFILKGHSDNILSIAVSRGAKYVLSGSRDHFAILWDVRTGKKLAVLKGMTSPVIFTAFSNSEHTMLTATSTGDIYLWSTENIDSLYHAQRLSRFSPFDYYNAGLEYKDPLVKKFFDTTSNVTLSYQRTFDYMSNMPDSNIYHNDDDYLHNLNLSFTEIDTLYDKLLKNPGFSRLTGPQQQYIKQLYNRLKWRKNDLLDEYNDDEKAKIDRKGQSFLLEVKNLIHNSDTSDIRNALVTSEKLTDYAIYYRDSIKSYSTGLEYLETAGKLISKYEVKNLKNPDLLYQQTVICYYSALNYLYLKKVDKAFAKANELKQINNGNELANVIDILGLIYQNKYDQAWQLFSEKENIVIWTGDQNISLRSRLIYILNGVKNNAQLPPAARRFLAAIQKRSNPAVLVKLKHIPKRKHRRA